MDDQKLKRPGVAAVYSANPEDIDIIKTWPGGNGAYKHCITLNVLMELTNFRHHER